MERLQTLKSKPKGRKDIIGPRMNAQPHTNKLNCCDDQNLPQRDIQLKHLSTLIIDIYIRYYVNKLFHKSIQNGMFSFRVKLYESLDVNIYQSNELRYIYIARYAAALLPCSYRIRTSTIHMSSTILYEQVFQRNFIIRCKHIKCYFKLFK